MPNETYPHYVIVLTKVTELTLAKETIQRHIEHLRNLDSKKLLVLCGPFSDHPSGMIVVRAESKEAAIKLAESDPFVIEGVRTFEVRTWILANAENNYLGN